MTTEDTPQSQIDLGPIVMSNPIAALFKALSMAQGKQGKLVKGSEAKIPGRDGKQGYAYDYADLADTIEVCRPHLSSCGLSLVQAAVSTPRGVEVSTLLGHESGQWLMIKALSMGGKPQEEGSRITYLRRYQLQPALGLAAEDDDGGEAMQASKPRARPKPTRPAVREPDLEDEPEDVDMPDAADAAAVRDLDDAISTYARMLGKLKGATFKAACKTAKINATSPGELSAEQVRLMLRLFRERMAKACADGYAKLDAASPGDYTPDERERCYCEIIGEDTWPSQPSHEQLLAVHTRLGELLTMITTERDQ